MSNFIGFISSIKRESVGKCVQTLFPLDNGDLGTNIGIAFAVETTSQQKAVTHLLADKLHSWPYHWKVLDEVFVGHTPFVFLQTQMEQIYEWPPKPDKERYRHEKLVQTLDLDGIQSPCVLVNQTYARQDGWNIYNLHMPSAYQTSEGKTRLVAVQFGDVSDKHFSKMESCIRSDGGHGYTDTIEKFICQYLSGITVGLNEAQVTRLLPNISQVLIVEPDLNNRLRFAGLSIGGPLSYSLSDDNKSIVASTRPAAITELTGKTHRELNLLPSKKFFTLGLGEEQKAYEISLCTPSHKEIY